jgi:FMN phosphatase YigB (HAD superfamily)
MTLHLLFDLDDTLLDSNIESLIPVYFQKLAGHLSDRVAPDQLIKHLMNGTLKMYANERFDQTLEQVFDENFYPALGLSRDLLAASIEQFYDEVFPTLQPMTSPRPEAIELVQWALGQGLKVSVATDPLFPRKAILHRLRWAGLALEDVPYALVSDFQTFHSAKVSVFYFAEFLMRLGWVDEPVLMIGDSLERDVLPARKAGVPVFWLKAEGQGDSRAEGIPQGSLADLRRLLETSDHSAFQVDFSSPSALIGSLKGTAAALHTFSRQIPVSAWNTRPGPGEWALAEVFCHLRDVEREVNLPRIETVLREANAFIAGKVTDPWAEERNYLAQDGAQALVDFFAAREELVAALQALAPSDWERGARHTIFGPTTLGELVGFIAEHDRAHAQQALRFL